MAIIETPSAPQAPTVADLQQICRDNIISQINRDFNEVTATFKNLFQMVWSNPQLNPQQVLDAFGKDAAQLFLIASAFQNAVNTVVPGTINQVPPYQVTINNDGTVTVGAPIA